MTAAVIETKARMAAERNITARLRRIDELKVWMRDAID
jgi:hypothetical protein